MNQDIPLTPLFLFPRIYISTDNYFLEHMTIIMSSQNMHYAPYTIVGLGLGENGVSSDFHPKFHRLFLSKVLIFTFIHSVRGWRF